MKFLIQQKPLTFFRNYFSIKDEEGNEVYNVKSTFLTIPYKMFFKDSEGNELLVIRRRYFRLMPRYDLRVGKEKIAHIKRKAGVFKKRFKIKSKINEDLNNLKIIGDILSLSFEVIKEDEIKASVSKKFISFGDRYSVTINDEKNFLMYLGIVITLDDILHARKKRR